MIIFDGKSLEAVAPVMIDDIIVSPIQWAAVTRDRPIAAGADFVRLTGRTRTVSITFALLTNDRDIRQRQMIAINAWARSETPKELVVPFREGHLKAICTAFPEPSTRQWWESKLRLVFTCYDPYWYSNAEKTVNCGTQFFVGGNAPPEMRLECTLSQSGNLTYTDGTDTMNLTGVPAGAVVIDLNRQTAFSGNTNIMDKYTFSSTFIQPKPGFVTITGTGKVVYRERWI
jgi:hypothetical protein